MPDLTQTTRVIRNPDLISTDVDGETVMMSIERGEYYGLGGTGSRIWQLLEEPMSVAELCRRIVAEFEVDEQTATDDTLAFLEQMLDDKLITLC